MTESTGYTLRIKQIPDHHPDLAPGFYWTLDEGEDAQCCWTGPHADEVGAKTAAIQAITQGYAEAARQMILGD